MMCWSSCDAASTSRGSPFSSLAQARIAPFCCAFAPFLTFEAEESDAPYIHFAVPTVTPG